MDYQVLKKQLQAWAVELGFQQCEVTNLDLSEYEEDFRTWLTLRFHGDMSYLARNVDKRLDPAQLHPGTIRIVSVRMDYWPDAKHGVLKANNQAYISRYALGRDYHKVLRRRLARLARRLQEQAGGNHRAFVDSAPVLEKPLAEKAGLGWVGKHTLLLNKRAGSYFFLGEIFTDIPLPISTQQSGDHCGACKACLNICPTKAIVGPRKLDARRCISYLTIEHKGSIPEEFREAIGNRVFGCDDCQLICPWNRYAKTTEVADFAPRHDLDNRAIADLLSWTEEEFLAHTEGMALRRINYRQWVRNLAVAAGNAEADSSLYTALHRQLDLARENRDPMLIEHLGWAVTRLSATQSTA